MSFKIITKFHCFFFNIEESEERRTIETSELNNKQFRELLDLLKNWINDELRYGSYEFKEIKLSLEINFLFFFNSNSFQRIIVKNLEDDLYDGQILGKLVEKLR